MAKFKVFDQKGRIWVYDTSSEKFENLDLYNRLTNNLGDFIPFDYSRTKEQIEAAKNPQGVPDPTEEEDRDDDRDDEDDEDEDEDDEDDEDEDEDDEDDEDEDEDRDDKDDESEEDETEQQENTENESPDGSNEPSAEPGPETPTPAGEPPPAMGTTPGATTVAGGGSTAVGAGGTAVAEEEIVVVAAGTSEFWVPILVAIAVVIAVIILIVAIFVIVFMIGDKDQAAGAELGVQTTICLDPGHPSEVSAGAPGEIKNNYVIATELKTLLTSKGYNVVLTKNSESENVTNAKRAEICSVAGASLMYRIHQDANTEPQRTFHIIPGPSLDKIHSSSLAYGKIIHETMIQDLGPLVKGGGNLLTDGKYLQEGTSEYSRVLEGSKKANELNLPAVLIEALALTTEGQAWLDNTSNRAALVKAIAAGIEKALPPGSGGTGSAGIVSKAKFYQSNNTEYRKDMMKPAGCGSDSLKDSDCGGFTTTTVVKSGADPDFASFGKSHRACQFVNYFQNNPKWETVYTPVNQDSSKLKPGDILVVSKMDSSGSCVSGWSHTGIYVGADGSGKGNKIEASLCDHGPEYGNWYSKFNYAFRKK